MHAFDEQTESHRYTASAFMQHGKNAQNITELHHTREECQYIK